MKNILCCLVVLLSYNTSYAQSPLALNISCFINSSAAASNSFGGYSQIMEEGAAFSYHQSRASYGSDEQFYYNMHQKENSPYNFPLGKTYGQRPDVFREERFRGSYKEMQKWIEEKKRKIKN